MKSNLHTHTTFSDGKNTPAEMAGVACAKGYSTLGFSDHSSLSGQSWTMSAADYPAYIAEIARLKSVYAGRMQVLCGLEWDALSDPPPFEQLDYVIGSVHGLRDSAGNIQWVDFSPAELEKAIEAFGGAESFVKRYYYELSELAHLPFVDIVGHFDLVTLFNRGGKFFDETASWYLAAAFSAADELIKAGKTFERNQSPVYKGLRDHAFPSPPILEHIKKRGGKVIATLDAHTIDIL